MKKILFITVLIFASFSSLFGQYGNEWINYSQTYYKFPIYEDGIYRITYSDLSNAGFPVGTVDPRNIQIFGHEQEIALNVEGEQDGVFDASDYIEFYAYKADGRLDSLIYVNPSDHPNKFYNFFNDTIQYFITWNNSTSNRRLVKSGSSSYGSYISQPYFYLFARLTDGSYYTFDSANGYISDPRYFAGEGFGSAPIAKGQSLTSSVTLNNVYLSSGGPSARVYSNSRTFGSYVQDFENRNSHVLIEYTNSPSTYKTIFNNTRLKPKVDNISFNIPNSELFSGSFSLKYSLIDDLGVDQDLLSFSELEVKYPSQINLQSASSLKFAFDSNISQPFVRLDPTNAMGSNLKIMGIENNVLVNVFFDGVNHFVVPNNKPSNYIFYSDSGIKPVAEILKVSTSGKFEDYLSQSLTNNLIIISHSSLWSKALEYKQYRMSPEGGGYNVILVDVDELYSQFGEGVDKSSISVRRFVKAALENWSDIQAVFILGKGIHNARHIKDNNWGSRKNASMYERTLIPVLGAPATDNMFSLGLLGDWNKMEVPIGRYAAKNNAEIDLYLNKIKEYDIQQNAPYTVEDREWQKRVLHFVGGSNSDEQNKFLGYTRWGVDNITTSFYGANVEEYLKNSNEPISASDLNLLTSKIKDGVSIIQLFGHSSYSGGFDTNLDNPNNWGNKGKYPNVVANGCNSGDIYNNATVQSNSEDYIITPNQGAISYISTTTSGYDIPLAHITESLYQNISQLNYGKSIASSVQKAVSFQLANYFDIKFTGSIATFNLHGDPLIGIYSSENPEYIIPYFGVTSVPEFPTLQNEIFDVVVDIYNVGKAVNDQVLVELIRRYPNGVDSIYYKEIDRVYNKSTVVFQLPLDPSKAEGINEIIVSVDIPSIVTEEYDEEINNQATKQLFILINGVSPTLPYEYAIVGDNQTLYASTNNPDQELLTYEIQIDTTDEFNSVELRYFEVTSSGGSISISSSDWLSKATNLPSPMLFEDSVVYFWRTTIKEDNDWKESSFQYIKDKYGWGQAHFFQFKKDDFNKLTYDKTLRKVDFDFQDARLEVDMYSNPTSGKEYTATQYKIFDDRIDYAGGGQLSPAIMAAVINPDDLSAWQTPKWVDLDGNGSLETLLNPTHLFGQFNLYGTTGRGRPDSYFVYQQSDQTQLQSIETLINAVPDGHYMLFYTFIKADYSDWDALYPNLYNVFQGLGADQIVSGQQDNMFAILCLKGDPSFTKQFYSLPVLNETNLYEWDVNFPINPAGFITSPKAGPAKEWNTIYWQQNPKEPTLGDSTHLYVYGVNYNEDEVLLIDTVMTVKDSIINLQNRINPEVYPYLKLKARFGDKVTLTPAHLQRWQILYQPVPEASIEPSLGLYYTATDNIVKEGQDIGFSVAFKNISSVDMDSILIKYWITDKFNKNHILKQVRKDSLRANQVMKDTLSFNTYGYPGTNSLWFEINPISDETGRPDQLEQHHFNNYYQKTLVVEEDKENPILDVTFDGVHIFDGDIVSPSPKILIKFNDENQFLKYNAEVDTSLFRVSLVYPDQIAETQIYFMNGLGEKVLDWRAETSGNKNQFIIEYNPKNLPDGIYKLKAQGSDVSNNVSGDLSYEVEFEVVNASTITYFYNYPNPFSTRTQFVFTVTGSEIPDEINIQIITITGKIVKTITAAELGPIHIGKNVTQYYWNGTDDFGDPLANGVYLYKVSAKIKGKSIEHRETSNDELFKHQFGKLYIMR